MFHVKPEVEVTSEARGRVRYAFELTRTRSVLGHSLSRSSGDRVVRTSQPIHCPSMRLPRVSCIRTGGSRRQRRGPNGILVQ